MLVDLGAARDFARLPLGRAGIGHRNLCTNWSDPVVRHQDDVWE
jgi:hypothetical protein